MRLFLIWAAVAAASLASAQSWLQYSTLQNIGGTSDETGRQMVIGPGGAYYTLSSSGSGLVVSRRDAVGGVTWKSFYPAEPSSLDVAADGSVAVVGRIDRGNQPSVKEILVLFFDPTGVLTWSRTLAGATTLPDPALFTDIDSSGNIYIGATVNQDAFSDLALVKYSPAGDLLWTKTLGPNPGQETCTGVRVDPTGNVLLYGTRGPAGAGTALVNKFGSEGNQIWTFSPNASGSLNAWAMDSSGASYLAIKGTLPWVVKAGSNGAQSWRTQLNPLANPLAIYVGGTTPYVAGSLDTTGNGFVSKLATTGALAWTATHTGPGSEQEAFNALAVGGDGIVYAAGNRALSGASEIVTLGVTAAGAVSWEKSNGVYAYTPPILPPLIPLPPPLVATNLVLNGSNQNITFATINGPGSETGYDTVLAVASSAGGSVVTNQDDLNGTHDVAKASVADAAGNFYLLGETEQGGGADAFLMKMTPSGSVAWVKGFGGPGPDIAYAIAKVPSGGVVCSYGVFNSSTSMWDTYVRRYDADGSLLYAKGPLSGSNHVVSSVVAPDGSAYVLGQDQSVVPYRFHTVKLGPDGAVLWDTLYEGLGPDNDFPYQITLSAAGTPYVVGNLWNGTRYRASIQKYGVATGSVSWTKTFSLIGNGAAGFGIAIDEVNQRIYVCGTDWANGSRGLLRKYDFDGNLKWSMIVADTDTIGERFMGVAVDKDGRVIVAGAGVKPEKGVDMLAAKYDATGALVWKRLYDGPAQLSDVGRSVLIDPFGAIYVGGTVSGGATGRDLVLWRLNPDGSNAWPISGDGFVNSAVIVDNGGLSNTYGGISLDSIGGVYLAAGSVGANRTYDFHAMSFAPTYGADFASQVIPTSMVAGQSYTVSATFTNTSNVPWTSGCGVSLVSVNPQDNMTWGLNKVPLAAGESIAPGQSKKFQFRIFAPTTPGTYDFQWQARNAVRLFGSPSTNVPITVASAGSAALYVSQTVPTSVRVNQSFTVSVKMKNVGTLAWTSAAGYGLGVPSGYPTWNVTTVGVGTTSIAPGQEKTFTFTCRAPASAGTYDMRFRMKKGTMFFGDSTPVKGILVKP